MLFLHTSIEQQFLFHCTTVNHAVNHMPIIAELAQQSAAILLPAVQIKRKLIVPASPYKWD